MSSTVADASPRRMLAPSRELDHVPGEPGPPIIGHMYGFLRDTVGLVDRQCARFGPNFRLSMLGNSTVVVGHPETVKEVLLDRQRNFSSRLGWGPAIGELFANGLMLRDFDDHLLHRRIMQAAFRAEALREYTAMMNPLIERSIARWNEIEGFRFYPAIKKLTLDIAAAVFLGLPLGEEADRLNRAFADAVAASIAVVKREVPGLSYRRGMNGRRVLERFFAELVPQRRRSPGSDLVSRLCQATSENGERFSDREIIDHLIFLLMAAHDTTTSSLTTVIWSLAQHPEWQDRLRDEGRALGVEQLSYDDRDRPEATDWVFKEALRLHPPVPFIGRRSVAACEVAGLRLPENASLSVCSLVTHKLEEYWDQPRRFDPERFSPERAEHKRHSHSYYPFGGGTHTCLGMHFAYLQVKAFLHQFLRRYRVSLIPGRRETLIPIPIPRPKRGLPLRLEVLNRANR